VPAERSCLVANGLRLIQEEGLRTYLHTYAPHYLTLSLSLLARTFQLPPKQVTSIISKMIWNEELTASLDQAAGVVIFHRVELTHAQQLAQSVAERVSGLVEQNEKNLDVKLGGGVWQERNSANASAKAGDTNRAERSRGNHAAKGWCDHHRMPHIFMISRCQSIESHEIRSGSRQSDGRCWRTPTRDCLNLCTMPRRVI
jgi:hypothetical protein